MLGTFDPFEDGHVIAITDAYGTADAVTTNYVWEGGLLVEVRDDGDKEGEKVSGTFIKGS